MCRKFSINDLCKCIECTILVGSYGKRGCIIWGISVNGANYITKDIIQRVIDVKTDL